MLVVQLMSWQLNTSSIPAYEDCRLSL